MPALQSCFPEGRQIELHRTMLRGFLAEALYRHSAELARGAGRSAAAE